MEKQRACLTDQWRKNLRFPSQLFLPEVVIFESRTKRICFKSYQRRRRIMKKYIIAAATISALSIWVFLPGFFNHPSSTWAAQTLLLADKHKNAGMTCDGCHKENPPQKRVPMGVCTGCHGDTLKLAELTNKSDINPHDSHVGCWNAILAIIPTSLLKTIAPDATISN
jgi:hypothetical protein